MLLKVVEQREGKYKRRCLSNRVIEDRLKQVGGLRFTFNVEVGKGINVRFDKVNKIGGDGENGRCLANFMSGKENVKVRGILRKLGRVMGIVQSKQVAVDFGWELEKISKLIV